MVMSRHFHSVSIIKIIGNKEERQVTEMEDKILLTITMLVSNRKDTIEKCMESLKSLLDHVPSELIVVDTAGDQECIKVVEKYTSNIVRFEWCNDFAAARNTGLKRAKGQWVMFLDDDEWFEDTKEIEEFFLNGTCQDYNGAAYFTRNYHNLEGTSWSDRIARRICRLEKNTRFVGKIHEYLKPLKEPVYYMKAYVHHYGYVYKTKQEELEHSWRNIKLLLESRKEQQEDCQVLAQLLQEYVIVGEKFSALEVARELCFHKDRYKPERLGFTGYAQIREIEIYRDQKLYQEAYQIGKEIVEEDKALLVSRGCIANLLVGICQQIEKYQEAILYIDQFRRYLKIWTENKERLQSSDFFSVGDNYLIQREELRLILVKIHIYVKQKMWEEGKKALEEMDWENQGTYLLDTPEDIIQIISHTEYSSGYEKGIKAILTVLEIRNLTYEKIDKLEGKERERVLFCISKIDSDDMQIMKYQLWYYFIMNDKNSVEKILLKWKKQNYSFFLSDLYYWEGLNKLQICLNKWMEEVRTEEWIRLTEVIFDKLEKKDCENVYGVLRKDLQKNDIRFLHITGLWIEKKLLEITDFDEVYDEFSEAWSQVYELASLWVGCAAMLYRETVFQGEEKLQSALPGKYQFAWLIYQANVVKGYPKNFVKKVAAAAKSYLKMEKVCKYILKTYAIEEDTRVLLNKKIFT